MQGNFTIINYTQTDIPAWDLSSSLYLQTLTCNQVKVCLPILALAILFYQQNLLHCLKFDKNNMDCWLENT